MLSMCKIHVQHSTNSDCSSLGDHIQHSTFIPARYDRYCKTFRRLLILTGHHVQSQNNESINRAEKVRLCLHHLELSADRHNFDYMCSICTVEANLGQIPGTTGPLPIAASPAVCAASRSVVRLAFELAALAGLVKLVVWPRTACSTYIA